MNSSHEFIERLETRAYVLEAFREAQSFIENGLGFTMTNIELVGLRRIAAQVIVETLEQEIRHRDSSVDSLSLIAPGKEIPARFIEEFYGVNSVDMVRFFDEYDEDAFKEFFRRKQAQLHFP